MKTNNYFVKALRGAPSYITLELKKAFVKKLEWIQKSDDHLAIDLDNAKRIGIRMNKKYYTLLKNIKELEKLQESPVEKRDEVDVELEEPYKLPEFRLTY